MNLEEIKKEFLEKLKSFPFESDEEALSWNISQYKINHNLTPIPLETPFTIQPKKSNKKEINKILEDTEEFIYSSSSVDEYSSTDEIYHEDINLFINLSIKSKLIIDSCELLIQRGKKYGLIGRNGIGKTTLLKNIKKRKFGIPRGIKIHMIEQETNLDIKVIDHVGENGTRILMGFGFTKEMCHLNLKDLSGGWRMRSHLAKAININPDLLLLDEPTNYLDIQALNWLEKQIKDLKTVIIVSHDKNFLNNVVDEILHLNDFKIDKYKGNYDTFSYIRNNKLNQIKKEYDNQLRQREHLQSFIDRFRASAARAALAQSKIKQLSKMLPLVVPKKDPIIKFIFDSTSVKGNLIEMRDVKFSYIKNKPIFRDITININNLSRIVVVGTNGQGKSTFLKMLTDNLQNCDGYILKNPELRVGYFAQHFVDNLNVNLRVLDLMLKYFTLEESKRALSNFGLQVENQRIGTLSGGQKSRLTFALINGKKPNLLVFDEPTNHLDMESIEALAECIKKFEGGVVCVSHDLNFVSKAFTEVYVCENQTLRYFNGTPSDYKASIQ
ncbi:ATP-binding cassette sub-family F (ABCF3) [Vairimorpha necatrix]|uniref:ATP-binding cassette sub-family F (ABCF3) n=1 Tax=Vairimorpha necatrix TaxID=6039 RepID=A0AAX4JBZ5_9MICR